MAPVALQQFRRDPYGSQFFCFRARFQTLFVLFSPRQYREVFQELQGRPLYDEKSSRVEESLPWASQNFLHFLTETWRLNTLETNSGLERFFDGKVTFLTKPGQLGQGERIRPWRALFSALGLRKGLNRFSYTNTSLS